MWKIIRIQEDDFGCEERPEDWEPQVIVTLEDDSGHRRQLRAADRLLLEQGLDVGSIWPENI